MNYNLKRSTISQNNCEYIVIENGELHTFDFTLFIEVNEFDDI